MKILNFGSCNIDFTYSVNHIVLPGETLSSSKLEVFPGGKGLNQSIALSRAGIKIYHAGCIGSDGAILKDVFLKDGIDISYLKETDGRSGHAIIQVSEDGENSIVLYGGCNRTITREYIDKVLADFSAGDILLLQNEINDVDYIVNKAHEKNITIVLNAAPITESVRKIDLNKLSYLIVNEIEAQSLAGKRTPTENLAELNARYPELKIVLTLGKQGCIYSDKKVILKQPSYNIEVKDTTAAGDTFVGYFIACIAKNKSVETALRLSSVASALAVSKKGASTSIPFMEEVTAATKVLKSNDTETAVTDKDITDYIEGNLQNASLSGLAENIGYSAGYTGVVVKRLTGKTFKKLLQEQRLNNAVKLLTETDIPVNEIVYECGYENASFFRAKFKKAFNQTPLHYRKQVKNLKG